MKQMTMVRWLTETIHLVEKETCKQVSEVALYRPLFDQLIREMGAQLSPRGIGVAAIGFTLDGRRIIPRESSYVLIEVS